MTAFLEAARDETPSVRSLQIQSQSFQELVGH